MLLTCPSCGCQASAELWKIDEDYREILAIHASLPAEIREEVWRYLSLFRPAKSRLSWSQVKRRLNALRVLISSGDVTHDHRPCRICPPSVWAAAMAQMQDRRDKISRPLTNHNYLIIVAYDLAGQQESNFTTNPVMVEPPKGGIPPSRAMVAVDRLMEFGRGGRA